MNMVSIRSIKRPTVRSQVEPKSKRIKSKADRSYHLLAAFGLPSHPITRSGYTVLSSAGLHIEWQPRNLVWPYSLGEHVEFAIEVVVGR